MQYYPSKGMSPFEDLYEQVHAMEKLEYHTAMLGERHMYRDGFLELQSTLAALAPLTHTLRICAGVLTYPLYDPLHIAEYMATLDVITKGRLDFGVGLGALDEIDAFGISLDGVGDRLDEALRVTSKLWEGNVVDFKGRFYRYRNVFVSPVPVQKPHPPILVGGRTHRVLRRAADLGDGWLVSPRETLTEAKEKSKFYQAEARRRNKSGRTVVIREAFVSKNREHAIAIAKPSITPMYTRHHNNSSRKPGETSESGFDFERMVEDLAFVIGSPDDCIAAVEKLGRALRTDEFCLRFQLPGVSQEETLSAIRLWGEKITPYFR